MRLLLPLAVLGVVLAGCVSQPSPGPGPGGPGPSAATWTQVCAISNWADACTARASPNESPSKTEIDLMVNPTDPLNVIVGSKDLDRTASNCVWAVPQATTDGGRTWTSVIIGGPRDARMADPTNPLFGWECITDPIMIFDAQGTAYYALQAYTIGSGGPNCPTDGVLPLPPLPVPVGAPVGCGSSFYLATSTDKGMTWPNDRIELMALGDGGVVFHDYPRMVFNAASGSVSTVWNAIGPAAVNPWVVTTRDGGASTDAPVIVQDPDRPTGTVFASGFAAAKDGTIYMTTGSGAGPNQTHVRLAISTDDARTFGEFREMLDVTDIDCPLPNTEFRCGTSIELAADTSEGPRAGRLYAVWDDGRNGNADIYCAWSDDATTWSEPVRVNQDTGTTAQWMARPVVGADGALHVLYMDRSYAPGDKLYDATHAWSTDGGLTWQTQRLTRVSSDGDLGVHQGGFPFIGDYVGVGIVGDHLYAGFPETVTGVAEIAVA
ncbi:MAG TPA: sialidase family protein, partial [Candidatus Thermoplasmatota archaeon]|nr:sialidase family protein [Candidatus Thermoplasmatota archaeon]